jgi:hypothetical protein
MERLYKKISELCRSEYPDIVNDAEIHYKSSGTPVKLRVHIIDGSFLDIWLSNTGKYSYHWERRHINGRIYRHDNAPHKKRALVNTFPKHFHQGTEEKVVESSIPDDPIKAVRYVMDYVRKKSNIADLE